MRRFALLLAVTACGPERPPPLVTELPLTATDQSVILGAVRGGETIELAALPIRDGRVEAPSTLPLATEALTLFALAYAEDLDGLALDPGPLTLASPDAPTRPLPEPDRLFRQVIEGATAGPWEELPRLEPPLRDARLPARCSRFTPRELRVPGDVSPTFLVASGDAILLGNLAGEIHRVTRDGRATRLFTGRLYFDARARADGRLELAGEGGQLDLGTLIPGDPPRLEVTPLATLPTGGELLFFTGDPGGDERFAASDSGEVLRFAAGAWTPIFQRPRPLGLAWLGPGMVRGVFANEFYLYGRDESGVGEDSVHASAIAGKVTSVALVPAVGPVAGTEYGQLYVRRSQGDWVFLEQREPALTQIRDVAAFGPGFLVARADALVQAIGETFCPSPTPYGRPGDADRPEIGLEVRDGYARRGRAELTVVGRDAVVTGWRGPEAERTPRLVWFSAE